MGTTSYVNYESLLLGRLIIVCFANTTWWHGSQAVPSISLACPKRTGVGVGGGFLKVFI